MKKDAYLHTGLQYIECFSALIFVEGHSRGAPEKYRALKPSKGLSMCDSSYIWMALAQPIASRHQVKLFNKVKSCAFERGGGKQVYMTVDPSFISGEAARAKCKVPCRGIHFAAAILVYRNTSVTQAPPFCENLQRRCGAYPKGISKQGTVLRGQLHG